MTSVESAKVRMASAAHASRHPDREQPCEPGAPVHVPEVATLAELLVYWADARRDLPCAYFVDLEDNVSSLRWRELHEGAVAWATALALLGVRAGHRVLLALPTGAELLIAFFACQWLGATPCITDTPARGKGLAVWCQRALPKLALVAPRLLIVESGMSDSVQAELERAGAPQQVVGTSSLPDLRADLNASSMSALSLPHSRAPSEPAILQFTSGTTSHPKAVACSQSAVLANLRAIGGQARQFYQGDLMVGWLPLFHDMGLVATTLSALAHGIPVALMPAAAFVLRPARWLWAMHMFRGSLAFAPNFAFRLCLRRLPEGHAELAGLDLSSWRTAFNAAELIHVETARSFSARFARQGFQPHAMTPAYGMAEMTVGVSSRASGEPLRVDVISRTRLGREGRAYGKPLADSDALELVSLGPVFAEHELEVHDPAGNPLPERCQGEIVLRGPSLFDGYFRDAAASSEALRDGWLHTGDLGYLSEGEVYITGRSKDVIIRAGENLHPHLLEEAAGGVPGVRAGRVAAVGLPSAAFGTEEIALLVETGTTSQEALQRLRGEIEATVQRISGMRPDHVVLVAPNTVPVTTSGKIRRASAREAILRKLAGQSAAPAT